MSKDVRHLYNDFIPEHYQLELEPDRDTMRIRGSVVITGKKKGRPSQRLTFHQRGVRVTSATITHHDKKGDTQHEVARINHHETFNEVRLHSDHLLYGGSYTVTMDFEGEIGEGMCGVYVCNYEVDGKKQQLVATQFQSHDARRAFPCIDEPSAKATFALTLISPLSEAAISNTPAISQTEKDGKLISVFETTPKMSTYLLAFVYGDMQSAATKTANGIDVRLWATKAHPAAALEYGLDAAKRAIEFLNDYYDVPYPLTKCDHVALPDFSVGAMENWGIITYRESCLLTDPAASSHSTRERIAIVISHELSHQWFGDLVTMKWWDDLWLNESFANVMEYVCVNGLYPEWSVWNSFVGHDGLSAIRRDSTAGVQAVKTGVRHPDEITSLFDPSIVYAKGGRLLNMLMNYLGEDVFRKGLKAYFTKHAYSNTTGDDLWAALSEASGKDVPAFMDPWILRPGLPVVRVTQKDKVLTLSQTQFLLDPAKADASRVWPVPLLGSTTAVPALLDKAEAVVTLPSADYIRIDQGAIGHYVVQYTEARHMQAIAAMVSSNKLNIPERLMLLNDSAMLSRAGSQPFTVTLELLEHYKTESDDPVWDMMALVLADARRFIDDDPALEKSMQALARTLIQTQFERLGWEEKPGESSDDTKLRATIIALGVYAEHAEIIKGALERFETYKKDPHTSLGELRGIILGAAVREAVPGALQYLLDLDVKTSDADLKEDLIGALTTTHNETDAEVLLARLTDGTKVRKNVVDYWLVYLMRNRYTRRTAWDWLQANWAWIEKTFSGDIAYDSIPRYAASCFNTRSMLEEYRAFFEPLQTQPALARTITLGIEELGNRVTWLERDLVGVQTYFKQKQ